MKTAEIMARKFLELLHVVSFSTSKCLTVRNIYTKSSV